MSHKPIDFKVIRRDANSWDIYEEAPWHCCKRLYCIRGQKGSYSVINEQDSDLNVHGFCHINAAMSHICECLMYE